MSYVKWTGNQDQGDGTTIEILKDGTEIRMGLPVQLNADTRKEMEARGRVFEDSSAEEAKAVAENPDVQQPVGADVAGTAPLFQNNNPSSQAEQVSDAGTDQGGSARNRS